MSNNNKRHDLIGRKFGKIVVQKISDKKKNNGFLWECLCECGKICYDTTQNLEKGHRLSCGCARKEKIDLVGLKTGMLTVVSYYGVRQYDGNHSERRWNCLCECGNYTNLATAKLTKGKIISCGCIMKKKGEKNKSWKGCGEISGSFWRQIRACAETRNLDFEINLEYIWELFLEQDRKCKLSGITIGFDKYKITASLDRIDSSKGYVVKNIQWVHKDINKIKTNFSQSYFLELCQKVNAYNQLG